MRIQHNIMAMSAYRNYNTNTAAVAKNLEKLSSGYKINRAGDDAAGLAISEKMRAQITGLNAAQKNVKDGISLVKTAEGAMQEIQDMLNRMDYLATQSANGTYQDEVDRENLNKEMEALKTEIDRIADSANFNGIKLLDGSLDETIKAVDEVKENQTVDTTETEALKIGVKLSEVGTVLGKDTVLHNDAASGKGTEFSVDLHNFEFDATAKGNSMTLKIGDAEVTLTANVDDNDAKLSGEDLVNAFLGQDARIDVSVKGEDGKQKPMPNGINGMEINGQKFDVEKGDLAYRLTFKQSAPPTDKSEEVNGSMEVSISGQLKPKMATYSFEASDLSATPAGAITTEGSVISIGSKSYTMSAGESVNNALTNMAKMGEIDGFKMDFDAASGKVTLTATEAGKKSALDVSFKPTKAGDTTALNTQNAADMGAEAVAATATFTVGAGKSAVVDGKTLTQGTAFTTTDSADGLFSIAFNETTGVVTITAKTAGVAGNENTIGITNDGTDDLLNFTGGKDAVADKFTIDVTGWNSDKLGALKIGTDEIKYSDAASENGAAVGTTGYTAKLVGNNLVITADKAGAIGNHGPATKLTGAVSYGVYDTANSKTPAQITLTEEVAGAEGGEMQNITEGKYGDFNVSTTAIKNVDAGGLNRLASTFFDLTEDMVREGSVITIAGTDYTFTAEAKTATDIDISSGDLAVIAQKLTDAANQNATTKSVYTVGHDGNRITVTETKEHAQKYADGSYAYDLRTEKGIEESLGFKGVKYDKEVVTTEAKEGGKALNLQIGDTSDPFNQMKVSIGDMHVKAMKYTDEEGNETSIKDIDIKTSENAQKAVDVIKNAINYVSSVRGDLGAYQNRLEHTANNLSVMAENIQDAESSIRDTDIAEEMMAYTKNNILVQSAQAMLAQANQVPQGVLQLLG